MHSITYLDIRPGDGTRITSVIGTLSAAVDVVGTPTHVVVGTDGAAHWIPVDRVIRVAEACDECEYARRRGGPPHEASANCESGGRPHCSCDICF